MQAVAIIALCIASAVVYGVLHDQITARVCVEYFTIGHPPVFATESPTLLGLGWGVLATWWVGLLLGLLLAVAARAGRRPKRGIRSLVRPVLSLLLVMGGCALLAGFAGFLLGSIGAVDLLEPLASCVPEGRQARFLADLWAHSASYFVGFLGGLMVVARVWRSRAHTIVTDASGPDDLAGQAAASAAGETRKRDGHGATDGVVGDGAPGHPMPSAFQLLDLPSQALAIQRFLRDRPVPEKLSWLSARGKLTRVPIGDPNARPVYRFESSVGLSCCFFFAGDEFVFIGDHTTYMVRGDGFASQETILPGGR